MWWNIEEKGGFLRSLEKPSVLREWRLAFRILDEPALTTEAVSLTSELANYLRATFSS